MVLPYVIAFGVMAWFAGGETGILASTQDQVATEWIAAPGPSDASDMAGTALPVLVASVFVLLCASMSQSQDRPAAPSAPPSPPLPLEPPDADRRDAELTRAQSELVRQTRLATIGQLSAGIAHDLRNPLGVIRNAAYLLRRRLAKHEIPTDLITIIEDEVRAADAIITNLMEMTRGKEPERSAVDLRAMVEEIVARIDAGKRVQWNVNFAEERHMCWCDANQIRRVLENLLHNALEAMKGEGEITITATRDIEHDFVLVRDSGPGIPPDIRPRLFEPLVTTKRTGAGLGLMVSRQIVERHGGRLELVDHDEPGAEFRITLPREPAAVLTI